MNDGKDIKHNSTTGLPGVDDAVGVPEAKWFVAIVNNRSEKADAEKLTKIGIENYVPTQTTFKVWKNGKKAKVEKVVISSIIFIHCTEEERKEIVKLPYIFRFMTNKAGTASANFGNKPLAVISDEEIKRLQFMLGQSDIPVTITDRTYRKGDKVRVIRGSLAGLEGDVLSVETDKSEVLVALEYFGCAKLQIDTVNLEIINDR